MTHGPLPDKSRSCRALFLQARASATQHTIPLKKTPTLRMPHALAEQCCNFAHTSLEEPPANPSSLARRGRCAKFVNNSHQKIKDFRSRALSFERGGSYNRPVEGRDFWERARARVSNDTELRMHMWRRKKSCISPSCAQPAQRRPSRFFLSFLRQNPDSAQEPRDCVLWSSNSKIIMINVKHHEISALEQLRD